MFRTVEIPLWLLGLILLFAAVTFASHFLFPSVRWFLRRRMERVVARLNERLPQPIAPFKLARRTDMIQRLIYDPGVVEEVAAYARNTDVREDVAFEAARRYAREIVPSFSASLYFGFATRAANLLGRSFFRTRVGYADRAAFDAISENATVIYVINHRSNMDYVLLTFLAARHAALSYAVGEWARVWPLSRFIRATGGYFIRRRNLNPLYRRVLARYVQLATRGGVTQAVFPEGRLSQDGHLGKPKLGILSYILADHADDSGREVVFVPVGVSYDRVLEDRVLLEARANGGRRFRFRILPFLAFALRQTFRLIFFRTYRFGFASLSFGRPLSLSEFVSEAQDDRAEVLGQKLISEIATILPVVPVPVIAMLMLEAGEMEAGTLKRRAAERIADLKKAGALLHLTQSDIENGIHIGIRGLVTRRILSQKQGVVSVCDQGRKLLNYYAAMVPGQDHDAAQKSAAT